MDLIEIGMGSILIALAFILFWFCALLVIVTVREVKGFKRDR